MTQEDFKNLRDLFIRRMTVDSETTDRRRKDFNQAIFMYEDENAFGEWNKDCEKRGLPIRDYCRTYPVYSRTDMDMVLQCFDNAVKDFMRSKEKVK